MCPLKKTQSKELFKKILRMKKTQGYQPILYGRRYIYIYQRCDISEVQEFWSHCSFSRFFLIEIHFKNNNFSIYMFFQWRFRK